MKHRILLVEDNRDSRELLTLLLTDAGHEVHACESMQAALRTSAQTHCEVLVSDIGLPDGGGCELIERLRRAGASPYAIAMTGYGSTQDIATTRAAGFHHHLVKPVNVDVLEKLIECVGSQRGTAA